MRRDQPTTPFDVDADDLTQQFWGAGKGWVSSEQPTVRRSNTARSKTPRSQEDTTGSLRVIREGFAAFRPQTAPNATGEIRRQRQHGAPRRPASAPTTHREATLAELAAGRSDVADRLESDWVDEYRYEDEPIPVTASRPVPRRPAPEYDVPLTPVQPLVERLGLGAVDPLLVRAGAIALALILLVPVVLSLRPERDDSLPGEIVEAPRQVVAGAAPAPVEMPATSVTGTAATGTAATGTQTTGADAAEPTAAVTPDTAAPAASTDTTDAPTDRAAVESALPGSTVASAPAAPAADAAEVDVVADRIVPACPQTYTAAPGDSWYRIADEAGVTPSELLAENNATTETVILPGDDVCLPEGASMPTPPSTTVAPAADEPADEPTPATTQPPSTTQPPTTVAPATTVAPVANLSRTEVQELIRQTWPEDEVEKALAVARRESNFIATADNGWCCYGVFQIYWTVHDGWLDDFGITERSDLFDARKNIAAAHAMWQRSGWGPWGG